MDKMTISVLQQIYGDFVLELERSAKGEKTSLPFILHTLPSSPIVADDEVFQVMVIGGSVFKQALVTRKGGRFDLLQKSTEDLPVFRKKEDLLHLIERHLHEDISVLAVNFAYPLSPIFSDGLLDGILLIPRKEHEFAGLVGEQVGKEIVGYFQKKQGRKLLVSVANDTVCLLLSGLSNYAASELAGGIVGTGVNFAMFLDERHVVNLESNCFDKFPQSEELKEIDRSSSQRGKSLFEKATSGAYLYKHFNLLSEKERLPYPVLDSTLALKELALSNSSHASELAINLIEKSAALVACQIAGISTFKKNSRLVFVMEGSFFWEGEIYKDLVDKYLSVLLPGNSIGFVKVADSSYIGAAKLVA